jgi:hypothetical protein
MPDLVAEIQVGVWEGVWGPRFFRGIQVVLLRGGSAYYWALADPDREEPGQVEWLAETPEIVWAVGGWMVATKIWRDAGALAMVRDRGFPEKGNVRVAPEDVAGLAALPGDEETDRCVRIIIYERSEVLIAEILRAFRPFSSFRIEILGPVYNGRYFEYEDPRRTVIDVPGTALKKRKRRALPEPR